MNKQDEREDWRYMDRLIAQLEDGASPDRASEAARRVSPRRGRACADVRDNGGHSQPCRKPDCATAKGCCDHCCWTI